MGNREFNKVKFWPLVQIKDDKENIIKWWKDDNNNNNNILDIAMKLCVTLKPSSEGSKHKWLYNDLQSFCPFWRYNKNINKNISKNIIKEFKDKFEERWAINESDNGQVIPKSLYERYQYLFGADPPPSRNFPIETPNTHICLPRELGYSDEYLKTFMEENKMTISGENIEELRAAIVFTVYARMLDISLYKKTPGKKHGIDYSKNNSKALYLDGVLANYLSTTSCVGYIHSDSVQDFYLFAHGGVSLEFIKTDNFTDLFGNINAKFSENNYNLCKHRVQDGGNKLSIDLLKEKIHKFNFEVSKLMESLLNEHDYVKTDYLKSLGILITLSVPDSDILKGTGYRAKMSPIVSELPIEDNLLSQVDLSSEGKKLYTFFGHIPNGCGYGFYKVGDQQYSISTDFSSSLFTSNIIFGKDTSAIESYDKNNLLLKLDTQNRELKLTGEIHIEINDNFIRFPTKTDKSKFMKIFKKGYVACKSHPDNVSSVSGVKLFHTKKLNNYKSLHINFNDNSSIQKQLDAFNKHNPDSNNPNIVFHGNATVTIDEDAPFKAEIFSFKNFRNKELVIYNIELNENKSLLHRFARATRKLLTRKSIPSARSNNSVVTNGGSRIHARKSKLRRNKLKLKTHKICKIHINKRRNSSRA